MNSLTNGKLGFSCCGKSHLMKADSLGGRSHWGVILAGGDGRRLLRLTHKIHGDNRPKQFSKVIGDQTLLDQTRRRVSRMIEPQQTLLVLTETHERYYRDDVGGAASSSLVIQPKNQGTAAAIIYSLLRVREIDSDAIVGFFPSDHHFSNEEALVANMELAFDAARSWPERVILLGVVPEAPEPEYGWIEPGTPLPSLSESMISHVNRFWEKPSPASAVNLMNTGCLWNSFVMVGQVGAFLYLIRRTVPHLLESFESIRRTLLTPTERNAAKKLYSRISSVGFSDEVLSASPSDLAVLRSSGLGWSDLGEPSRVLSLLQRRRDETVTTPFAGDTPQGDWTEQAVHHATHR